MIQHVGQHAMQTLLLVHNMTEKNVGHVFDIMSRALVCYSLVSMLILEQLLYITRRTDSHKMYYVAYITSTMAYTT